MAAFPVAKLGALLLKQLSKPIANYAKERAKTHPFFRRHICMPPAQCGRFLAFVYLGTHILIIMVVGAFPIVQLGALFIKHVSRPIANRITAYAKIHPFFRKHVCLPPAQIYNWCEVKMKMWVLNMGKPVEVPKLNETMAIELGANLLGETIIFTIAAIILSLEYVRQVRKESKKEEARVNELTQLTNAINDLYFQAEAQDAKMKEMHRYMIDIESKLNKVLHRPYGPKSSGPSGTGGDALPINDEEIINRINHSKYHGVVLRALDYLTYQIPNGYY